MTSNHGCVVRVPAFEVKLDEETKKNFALFHCTVTRGQSSVTVFRRMHDFKDFDKEWGAVYAALHKTKALKKPNVNDLLMGSKEKFNKRQALLDAYLSSLIDIACLQPFLAVFLELPDEWLGLNSKGGGAVDMNAFLQAGGKRGNDMRARNKATKDKERFVQQHKNALSGLLGGGVAQSMPLTMANIAKRSGLYPPQLVGASKREQKSSFGGGGGGFGGGGSSFGGGGGGSGGGFGGSSFVSYVHSDKPLANGCMAEALADFNDTDDGCIALSEGTRVTVVDASDESWISVKTSSGDTGYFPRNYLTYLEKTKAPAPRRPPARAKSMVPRSMTANTTSGVPSAPRAPQAPPMRGGYSNSTQSDTKKKGFLQKAGGSLKSMFSKVSARFTKKDGTQPSSMNATVVEDNVDVPVGSAPVRKPTFPDVIKQSSTPLSQPPPRTRGKQPPARSQKGVTFKASNVMKPPSRMQGRRPTAPPMRSSALSKALGGPPQAPSALSKALGGPPQAPPAPAPPSSQPSKQQASVDTFLGRSELGGGGFTGPSDFANKMAQGATGGGSSNAGSGHSSTTGGGSGGGISGGGNLSTRELKLVATAPETREELFELPVSKLVDLVLAYQKCAKTAGSHVQSGLGETPVHKTVSKLMSSRSTGGGGATGGATGGGGGGSRFSSKSKSVMFGRSSGSLLGGVKKSPFVNKMVRNTSSKTTESKSKSSSSSNRSDAERSGTYYSLEVLQTDDLPDGVEKSRREEYLEPAVFRSVFGMGLEEFRGLSQWKRSKMKRQNRLF